MAKLIMQKHFGSILFPEYSYIAIEPIASPKHFHGAATSKSCLRPLPNNTKMNDSMEHTAIFPERCNSDIARPP